MNVSKGFLTRVRKELKELKETKPHGIDVSLPTDSLQMWEALITGPAQSLYTGGKFKIQIYLPQTYPLAPPSVRFLSSIYHLNVQPSTGHVCVGALSEENWLPTRSIEDVLSAVFSLLIRPVVENAADQERLDTFNSRRAVYNQRARTSAKNAK